MNASIEDQLNPVKCVGMEQVTGASDLTIDHMSQARQRIAPYVHNTPILTSTYLNDPDLLTIGGSWVTPQDLVHNLQFSQITKLAKEAVSLGN